ncbi:hypothetical protein EUX98_g3493 [Antrodiella citrinella]|uniref:C2 domain-containing protein n=1 Tax=Antrodiella citrinella TaxID=2447956 RepID=A0A4S4MWD3_9APHY|nr:hypothetical protein EUX98_g3493 [Antrodiella citrinella]
MFSSPSYASSSSSTLETPDIENVGVGLQVNCTPPLNVAPRTGVIVVELTIISALNLPLTRFRVKQPNPRLTVITDGTPASYQTATAHRSINPTWNESIQITFKDLDSSIHFQIAHNSNIPTYEYVLGEATITVRTLPSRISQTLELPLNPVDLPGLEHCGSVIISARRTVARKVESQYGGRTFSTKIAILGSPRTFSLARTLTGDTQNTKGLHAFLRVLAQLETLDKLTQEVLEFYPLVPLTWSMMSTLFKAINSTAEFEKDAKVADLLQEMSEVYHFVDEFQTTPVMFMTLQFIMTRILKQTIDCGIFLQEYFEIGFAGRLRRSRFETIKILRTYIRSFQTFHRALRSGISPSNRQSISFPSSSGVQLLVMDAHIKRLNPVEMDGAHRVPCPPRTSLNILQDISDWIIDAHERSTILWLRGRSQSERSMVATTVAHFFRDLSRLGAFIFFDSADTPPRRNPTFLFRTIAAQLATFNPSIAEAVVSAIQTIPSIAQATLALQFSELLLKPLLLHQESNTQYEGPIVIVIDGLDGCEAGPARDAVLSVLAEQSSKLPRFVRMVVTSSPAPDICDVFRQRTVSLKEMDDMAA